MFDWRTACPTLSGHRRAAAASLLLALMLAGCNDDGSSDPTAPFVDPTGEYSISINQTTDSCFDQTGIFNWGGATLDLQGNTLMVDVPQAPADPNCIHVAVPYSMNTIQGTTSHPRTVGSCNMTETVSLQLVFTTTGFSGFYSISLTRVSGVCALPPLPCESSGTVLGTPGLGSPACP